MTYSSAVFTDDEAPLAEAQREKYRGLAERASIRAGDRVLEIGSGWGGFACFLADELGCRVTTITVSKEQHDFVDKLVAEQGLADRVDARLADFRAVDGAFDRVVSVEMMESIPQRLWDPFFRQLRERVRPGGTVGLQLIMVADRHWQSSNEHPDFVRRYIFPGGQVPHSGCCAGWRAVTGSRGATMRGSGGRTRGRSPPGSRTSTMPGLASVRWGSTIASAACGGTTSLTARRASRAVAPTFARSCSTAADTRRAVRQAFADHRPPPHGPDTPTKVASPGWRVKRERGRCRYHPP